MLNLVVSEFLFDKYLEVFETEANLAAVLNNEIKK